MVLLKTMCIGVLILACHCQEPNELSKKDGDQLHRHESELRIVGGVSTKIKYFPYQVALEVYRQPICGGSIISRSYILTAAHCISFRPSMYSVRAGSTYARVGGIVIPVRDAFIHPWYIRKQHQNDIAVLLLFQPLLFSNNIAPIKLASQNIVIMKNVIGVITGWGDLRSGSTKGSDVLQTAMVPIYSLRECQDIYRRRGKIVRDSMFCAGYRAGSIDGCQGDSGGPLVIKNVLVGISSWGVGCAQPNVPGVYTSVPYFRSFISNVTRGEV